jgi:DNA sulfur modification protein DndE
MTWRTFGGDYADIYESLLVARCLKDGVDISTNELSIQLRQHIYRGIGYMAATGRIYGIADLAALVSADSDIEKVA